MVAWEVCGVNDWLIVLHFLKKKSERDHHRYQNDCKLKFPFFMNFLRLWL